MVRIFDLIKNTNIIKIHTDETISSAISKLGSSHDAAFAFSQEGAYKGVINPYYCFIKSSSPANAKVEHCLFHAPHIKMNYPLSRVAELMIESKIHYLPVFGDQEQFMGIISARRLLAGLKGSNLFKVPIKESLKLKKHPIITVFEDDFISIALNTFKMYKVSKLVVVSRDMKLKGILSYYDIISYLIAPKEKEHWGGKEGDKSSFSHQRVRNFLKSFVLTLKPDDSMEEALRLIIEKKIGSVVIMDTNRHPVGIITSSDFLRILSKDHKEDILEITSKDLSQKNRQIVGGFFYKFNIWLKRIPNLVKAKLFIKEEKQGGVFKVNLALIPKKGEPKVIQQEGNNLLKVLKKMKND